MSFFAIIRRKLRRLYDNTFYEDEEAFEAIIETLAKGTEIALLRMKQIIKHVDEDDCDCY